MNGVDVYRSSPKRQLLYGLLGVVVVAVTIANGAEVENLSDAEIQLRGLRPAEGLKVELFAAEPMLQNPVSICIDEQGRWFVAETHRHSAGVTDTRSHMDWLDDDLACRTVDDRVAMLHRKLGDQAYTFATESERIRLIEDRDGDGRADFAVTYADGFYDIASGIGASVLARNGKLWYTNLPDLWLLSDTNGNGIADFRKSLHHGYGVHIGFLGHDLHGLCFGPDGKLYFSIGDRGLHVKTQGKLLNYPDTGTVLRCNPDGSELEVFAMGLRNPQELTFDKFGNLWTGDNNSDGGDKARWVYVVEGGDSGWRIGFQFISGRSVWNSEKLWHLGDQAASQVPPVAHIGRGPSGLVFNPGTGLPPKYDDCFFMCDFPGGVNSWRVKPKGASFEIRDLEKFIWEMFPVDVSFGWDGGLYVADWVKAWNKTGKGRIFRVYDEQAAAQPIVAETKRLIRQGMDHRDTDELIRLLAHRDQRVRQRAQFALVARGAEVVESLQNVAATSKHRLARLHAIWALGQLSRSNSEVIAPLLDLLNDADVEVRANVVRVFKDRRYMPAFEPLLVRLIDKSLRVRFFAAMALGKLGRTEAVEPILDMLRHNEDQDAYLRHAGVMGLVWIGDVEAIRKAARDDSASVRLAALVALRRMKRPEVAAFLDDAEPRLVLEAARAINDVPIPEGMPALAAKIKRADCSEAILPRVLNANYRLGKPEGAKALAAFAAREAVSTPKRIEAIQLLASWEKPSGRDRIMGLWRPLPVRDAKPARDALAGVLPDLLKDRSLAVRIEAIRAVGGLKLAEAAERLLSIYKNPKARSRLRAETLKTLATLKTPHTNEAVLAALEDSDQVVFKQGLRLIQRLNLPDAAARLEKVILSDAAPVATRQVAATTLGKLANGPADAALARCLDKVLDGSLPASLHLDVLEAARRRNTPALAERLARYEAAAKSSDDPLAPHRALLQGGDRERGRKVFFEKQEAQCLKCHTVRGKGGIVGPDLSRIGADRPREKLLQSMLFPNKEIAPEFQWILVITADGRDISGRIVKETPDQLVLLNSEGENVPVSKSTIKIRRPTLSAMPQNVTELLTRRDLRDLVEFLSSLRSGPKKN